VRSYPHSQEILQATQKFINHILRFSISFKTVSVRINSMRVSVIGLVLERVREQGGAALCIGS
jgi:hypothetical protein